MATIVQSWSGSAEPQLPLGGDLNLLKGVYNRMCAEFNGGRAAPMTINVYADVPRGSGLGTSSAMVVALVGGVFPAAAAVVGGFLLANYYFTPPLYQFLIQLLVSLVGSTCWITKTSRKIGVLDYDAASRQTRLYHGCQTVLRLVQV